jgi:hypothetical protein
MSAVFADDAMRTIGAIRTDEVEDRDRPGIYGGRWKGALSVLTHRAPVVLRDGVRFLEGPPARLEKIGVAESGRLTDLRFRVVK